MVESDAVFQVSNGVLDLGVAAMIGLQFQGFPVPVGDEAVIAVGGQEGQLGTGRGLDPPDDEPHRRGAGFTLEGGIGGLGHIGGAVHPVGNRRPVLLGDRLNQLPQAFVLADGDGEADTHLAADGDESVGVEAAVGAHRELAAGPTVAHPPHRFTQEVGSAASGVGTALAQPGHQHVAGSGGDGQQWVIAPRAGVVVVSRPLLCPVHRSGRWWSPGRWSGASRRVRPQRPMRVPATGGSPGRVDGHAPTGSCAGRCPGWMAP